MATQKKNTTKKTNKKTTVTKKVNSAKKEKPKTSRSKAANAAGKKAKSSSSLKSGKKTKTGKSESLKEKTLRSKRTSAKKTVKAKPKSVRQTSGKKFKPLLENIVSINAETITTAEDGSRLPQVPPEKADAYRLANRISRLMLEKKAEKVAILDVGKLTGVMDYFVIASGMADIHIQAITDHILDTLTKEGEKPHHVEGAQAYKWVLIDFIDVVVHIFENETRSFYDLERLWGDAPVIPVRDSAEN